MSDTGYTDGRPNPHYLGDCKYCSMKADIITILHLEFNQARRRIADLEKINLNCDVHEQRLKATIERLDAENAKLREKVVAAESVVMYCADEINDEEIPALADGKMFKVRVALLEKEPK